MTLHLIKLAVGASSFEDIQLYQAERLKSMTMRGLPRLIPHITRMMPKRREDLMEGGSLYWVVKGHISCRQKIADIQSVQDAEGIARAALMLDPELFLVRPQPFRPFQGWRYLKSEDAPPDLDRDSVMLPDHLKAELKNLGLL